MTPERCRQCEALISGFECESPIHRSGQLTKQPGTGTTPVHAFFRHAGGLEVVNDFRTIAGKQRLEDFRVNLIGQKSHSSVSKHDIESLTCIVEQTVER